jgi:hypothetical protein
MSESEVRDQPERKRAPYWKLVLGIFAGSFVGTLLVHGWPLTGKAIITWCLGACSP